MGDSERAGDVGEAVGQKRSRSQDGDRTNHPRQGSTSLPATQDPSTVIGQGQQPPLPLSLIPCHPPPQPPPLNRNPLHPVLQPPPLTLLPSPSYAPPLPPQMPSPAQSRSLTSPIIYQPRQPSPQASSSGRINWPMTKRRKAGNSEDSDDEQGSPRAGGCREAGKRNPGDPDMEID